jgi:carbonic anhydrase
MRILWLMLGVLAFTTAAAAQWKTPWEYEGPTGPDHWGDLDPDYAACETGREQSPIDIRGTVKANLPALRFEYKSSPLKYLIDNGHTIRINFHDAPGTGSALMVGDKRYELTQLHFHRPAEEFIDGKAYDMVLHLMHQAANGKVVGVAVFLKSGRANATVNEIWSHWPTAIDKETDVPGIDMNPATLLPHDLGYFSYEGSLTAPPCTEGVTWYVLKTPVEISAEQIAAFAKHYPHDVRTPQPLNGRVVKESQ